MFEIRIYDKHRLIPWESGYVHLTPGLPLKTDNAELVEHIRKFSNPEQHRGIGIKEVEIKPRNPSRMKLQELRDLAVSLDVEYEQSDSRNDIMKRIKVTNNA